MPLSSTTMPLSSTTLPLSVTRNAVRLTSMLFPVWCLTVTRPDALFRPVFSPCFSVWVISIPWSTSLRSGQDGIACWFDALALFPLVLGELEVQTGGAEYPCQVDT